jgi:hypothetical protein
MEHARSDGGEAGSSDGVGTCLLSLGRVAWLYIGSPSGPSPAHFQPSSAGAVKKQGSWSSTQLIRRLILR